MFALGCFAVAAFCFWYLTVYDKWQKREYAKLVANAKSIHDVIYQDKMLVEYVEVFNKRAYRSRASNGDAVITMETDNKQTITVFNITEFEILNLRREAMKKGIEKITYHNQKTDLANQIYVIDVKTGYRDIYTRTRLGVPDKFIKHEYPHEHVWVDVQPSLCSDFKINELMDIESPYYNPVLKGGALDERK